MATVFWTGPKEGATTATVVIGVALNNVLPNRAAIAAPQAIITVGGATPEYSEDQFYADINKASGPLKVLATKARKSLRDGTARKFPG